MRYSADVGYARAQAVTHHYHKTVRYGYRLTHPTELRNFGWLTSCTKINFTQVTCRGTSCGYPRVKELAILITGARCELAQEK
jgi:hypothetical protein